MSFVDPISLHGQRVSLVPLSPSHHDDLAAAVKDGELWKLWYTKIPAPEQMRGGNRPAPGAQKQASMTPFAVIEKSSGEAVGMTTFMNIDAANRRVEIGSTWYRKRVQRSALNTECKLLLLGHAFERLNCIAVEFRTHFFNQQSRCGHRTPGREIGRHTAPASARGQRHPARHLRVQHSRS